jgi:uncharacterized protein
LRWAVNQPMAWKIANNYGFYVDRTTVSREGKPLETPEIILLTERPIKPQPLSIWQKAVKNSNQAAIIAQALYGEKFDVEMATSGMTSVIAQSEELMQRFTFSLLAADQNFEAAQLAGWAFVDSTAKPNEKYIYRVYADVPESIVKIKEATAFIGLSDFQELPPPIDVSALFSDKTVLLSWNYQVHQHLYASFFIERSEDSIHFNRLSDIPITNLITQENPSPTMMVYNDSLPTNDKNYWYRVRGMSSFGEVGLPSVTVKGMGEKSVAFAPVITNFEVLPDSSLKLDWRFPDEAGASLHHFAISLSDDVDGTYKILKDSISATERSITVKTQQSSNYLIVSAIDKKGSKYESYSQFVQLDDGTPPSVPTGLVGDIDENGYISLTWIANKERDFHGYYVYRCNVKGEEMSLMNADPLTINQFCDSADLKMLNSKVYYTVVALDKRFNKSAMSAVFELTKPDKNPPVAPVFTNYLLEEEKVILSWIGSSSDDVVFQRLYKKEPTNLNTGNQWLLVKEFDTQDSLTFTDDKVKGGATLSYTLVSVDKSKNESTPSSPLTVVVPMNKKNKAAVKDLKAQSDRLNKKIMLDWVYDVKGVVEYQVYKTVINEPFMLWKVLDNTSLAIEDTDVNASNIYKYAVRAVFNDGTTSVWREIKVEF